MQSTKMQFSKSFNLPDCKVLIQDVFIWYFLIQGFLAHNFL